MSTRKTKPWEGRFAAATAPIVEEFTASILVDKRLAPYDIAGSLAHCHMLVACGIIPAADGKKIAKGLADIEKEIRRIIPSREIATLVQNIGFPVSGINMTYNNTGTIGSAAGCRYQRWMNE